MDKYEQHRASFMGECCRRHHVIFTPPSLSIWQRPEPADLCRGGEGLSALLCGSPEICEFHALRALLEVPVRWTTTLASHSALSLLCDSASPTLPLLARSSRYARPPSLHGCRASRGLATLARWHRGRTCKGDGAHSRPGVKGQRRRP